MSKKIVIFDSTLRDGAQSEGISYSVEDKWKIVQALDELGVDYIEAGNPGSNPKDLEFFSQAKKTKIKQSKLVAFGSTKRLGFRIEEDANLQALLKANTCGVAIFGKSWDFHVRRIIKTSLAEYLRIIKETVSFLRKQDKEVIFDAEHFFDGMKSNPKYAMATLQAAAEEGASWLVLCDTNGGTLPQEVYEITKKIVKTFSLPIGIHCHNDCGLAVANSIMAVEAGATQVQGTFIGFGERCGNANLSTIIPTLQLKKGLQCINENKMSKLTSVARYIAEISNLRLSNSMPYVGKSAFTHKGGMHIDGVLKDPRSFEQIQPEKVGNERRFLMSEISGRSTILSKLHKISPELRKNSSAAQRIIELLKDLEYKGYQFEAAESSFELRVRKYLGKYKPLFQLESFTIIDGQLLQNSNVSSSAIIKVNVDGQQEITASEGKGPVNALDKALRKALEVFYPELKKMRLTDYKVRVINPGEATAAKVRVLIESTDGKESWTTVGVSTDIIEASCLALVDSIEYKLIKNIEKKFKVFV
ncbi:MAG: citramalate synthase [Candidatus Aminicenantales bacterium]